MTEIINMKKMAAVSGENFRFFFCLCKDFALFIIFQYTLLGETLEMIIPAQRVKRKDLFKRIIIFFKISLTVYKIYLF